jgi:hypothetical protein
VLLGETGPEPAVVDVHEAHVAAAMTIETSEIRDRLLFMDHFRYGQPASPNAK